MDEQKQSGQSRPWVLPPLGQVDSPSAAEFVRSTFETSGATADAAALREAARQEGYRQGYDEGMARALAESEQLQRELADTLDFLRQPAARIDARVEHELVELALAVAKAILRREVSVDPNHLIGMIRGAIEQLPPGERDIQIHLHPEAAGVVEKTLKQYDRDRSWKIVRDPALGRGDCRIHADPSYIDASPAALVDQLAVELLGGNRKSDPGLAVAEESNDAN